jgi:hypothetical protein
MIQGPVRSLIPTINEIKMALTKNLDIDFSRIRRRNKRIKKISKLFKLSI